MNNKELIQGISIEREHVNTYIKIIRYFDKYNSFPEPDFVYSWIAEDHLNESKEKRNPNYYSMLILMEKLMELGITSIDIKDKFNLEENL